MDSPYGKTFITKAPVQAECWNFSSGTIYTLPAGTSLEVEHINDSTHTTCMTKGIQLDENIGYRFIIENQDLSVAIGVSMPEKTADLVGDLIAYESGEASPEQTKKLFKTLRKSGIGSKLQGHYSSKT